MGYGHDVFRRISGAKYEIYASLSVGVLSDGFAFGFEYNRAGQLVRVLHDAGGDELREVRYRYNSRGAPDTLRYVATGRLPATLAHYTYGLAGQVLSRDDGLTGVETRAYDYQGAVRQITVHEGSATLWSQTLTRSPAGFPTPTARSTSGAARTARRVRWRSIRWARCARLTARSISTAPTGSAST